MSEPAKAHPELYSEPIKAKAMQSAAYIILLFIDRLPAVNASIKHAANYYALNAFLWCYYFVIAYAFSKEAAHPPDSNSNYHHKNNVYY